MSKKSRILSVLAIVLCLCLSGVIGYHTGHTIGFQTGQTEGYTDGYVTGYLEARNPFISAAEPSVYTSAENSIAHRQADQGNVILPLEARAFESNYGDFELKQLQWWTGHETFRSFFESLGIAIVEESELAGWFKCQLPEGWSVSYDDTPDRSRDETVSYLMPDGTEAFHVTSHKNKTDCATSLAPNLDLFDNLFED